MKKSLLLVAAMILGSSAAMASGKMHFKAGYLNNTSKTGSVETGNSYFAPEVVLADFQGKVGEADFRLLLDFVQLSAGSNVNTVNEAWMAKKVSDFKFSIGKLAINAGGFENMYVATGDTYMTSLANNGGLVATAGKNLGLGVDYMMGDHTLSFQALNQTSSGVLTSSTQDKRHSLGLQYKGSFADKMLTVLAGQMAGSEDVYTGTPVGKSRTHTYVGLNVKAMENLSLELESITNTLKASTTGATADMTASMILEARYTMGVYTPVFKFESSEDKDNEDATLSTSKKRTGMSLALEVKPVADDAFNYYVGYNMITDKPGSTGAVDTTDNKLFAGIKFTGDLLK